MFTLHLVYHRAHSEFLERVEWLRQNPPTELSESVGLKISNPISNLVEAALTEAFKQVDKRYIEDLGQCVQQTTTCSFRTDVW